MAKRLMKRRIVIECDDVNSSYTMKECTYYLDDNAVSDVIYTSLVGPNPCPEATIESADLTGTLQAYLDSIKTDIETQEGI